VEAVDAAGVAAGDDDETWVALRGDRGPDLRGHRRRLNQALAGQMPAPFRQNLVFEMNPRGPGRLKQSNGPLYIQCFAEAGVGIAQERQAGRLSDKPGLLDELGQSNEADVG